MSTPNVCYGCKQRVCNVCRQCHDAACEFTGREVVTVQQALKYKPILAKTQKAQGFFALTDVVQAYPTSYSSYLTESAYLVQNSRDAQMISEALYGESRRFVRPCPTRPRHGFVDSRPIDCSVGTTPTQLGEQLSTLLQESIAADEQGTAELLVMPYIDAAYNLIITPSMMAIGPGHDGATAGRHSIAVPLMGRRCWEFAQNPQVLTAAGIGADDDPFVEIVKGVDGHLHLTQLRAGPKAVVGQDYVPADMTVTAIIEPSDDLLEWERQVQSLAPGTVVCKPGGTLIAHYGVHCLFNRVPCVTSHVPKVGDVLTATGTTPTPDLRAVTQGLAHGALIDLPVHDIHSTSYRKAQQAALKVMMVALHNAGAMNGTDAYWLGFAASIMMRVGMAASHGEARHAFNGMSTDAQRAQIYELAFERFLESRNLLGTTQWLFTHLRWSSSYGGRAWATCTESLFDLDACIRGFLKDPSEAGVSCIVTALNTAVNQAHNGGWWLNKFIEQSVFTAASRQQMDVLAAAGIAMHQFREQAKLLTAQAMLPGAPDPVEQLLTSWAAAPDIAVERGVAALHEAVVGGTATVGGSGLNSAKEVDPDEDEEDLEECANCGSTYHTTGECEVEEESDDEESAEDNDTTADEADEANENEVVMKAAAVPSAAKKPIKASSHPPVDQVEFLKAQLRVVQETPDGVVVHLQYQLKPQGTHCTILGAQTGLPYVVDATYLSKFYWSTNVTLPGVTLADIGYWLEPAVGCTSWAAGSTEKYRPMNAAGWRLMAGWHVFEFSGKGTEVVAQAFAEKLGGGKWGTVIEGVFNKKPPKAVIEPVETVETAVTVAAEEEVTYAESV